MKTIAIEKLNDYLNYSDLRAVRNWCSKNDVLIIRQGKCEFVIESNFKEAYELPFISKLKKKFGKDWESVYLLYFEGNIPALHLINQLSSSQMPVYKKYKPEENEFVIKLKEYERKKKNAA